MKRLSSSLGIATLVASCLWPVAGFTGDSPPAPDLPTAISPDGHEFRLEIARTPQQRAMGYMYRSRVGPDEGMLFLFDQSAFHSFWMKNCLVSLDILWLSEDLHVVYVEPNVPPCREDPCPGYLPLSKARYVLEIAGGMTKKTRLRVGDEIRLRGIDLKDYSPKP